MTCQSEACLTLIKKIKHISEYICFSTELAAKLTCTQPASVSCRMCARLFISFTSYGEESEHWPFMIGLMKRLQNSLRVPSKFGFTKFTMQWSNITFIAARSCQNPYNLFLTLLVRVHPTWSMKPSQPCLHYIPRVTMTVTDVEQLTVPNAVELHLKSNTTQPS